MNKKALRQKRLQDAYLHGSSKNLSPDRNRSNSHVSKNATPHAAYINQVATIGPQSTMSSKLDTNSNIKILGETPLQNSASDLSNSIHNKNTHSRQMLHHSTVKQNNSF